LKPVAPWDEAERIVPLMGGRDAVLAAAAEAMEKKEYAWAAQLVNYLYRLDPEDPEVRKAKADALRQMAYVSTGANDRAHLMTQALALEGKVTVPRVIPPAPEVIAASPATYVDHFRVRIDPTKSGDTDKVLRFDFADGSNAGLHVRRAVAEFVASPDDHYREPDMTLAMSGDAWAQIFLSQAAPADLIASGEIEVAGDAAEAARVIDLFDRYVQEEAVLVPPAAYSSQR
jgi:alkyl sulfatase BDS1-like metallo-beta-lactamase superfamily hydrolase